MNKTVTFNLTFMLLFLIHCVYILQDEEEEIKLEINVLRKVCILFGFSNLWCLLCPHKCFILELFCIAYINWVDAFSGVLFLKNTCNKGDYNNNNNNKYLNYNVKKRRE